MTGAQSAWNKTNCLHAASHGYFEGALHTPVNLTTPFLPLPCARVRSLASASEQAEANPSVGLEAEFGSALCWRSRPARASSTLATGGGTEGEDDSPGSEHDDDMETDDSKDGQACFLSCLYMLLRHLRGVQAEGDEEEDEEEGKDTTDWLMRELLSLMNPSFPPVALALHQLRDSEGVTEAECACLIQCLWGLVREIVPRDVRDNCVLEHSRAFLMWLLSRAASSKEYAGKQSARARLIQKSAAAASAAATTAAATTGVTAAATTATSATATETAGLAEDGTEVSSSPGMSKADAKAETVYFYCSLLMERLEPGHAAHLRVNGEWLPGAYSRGGVLQKRQEFVPDTHGAKDDAAEGGTAEPTKFEVVWWEAAQRLLLSCPFSARLAVLRCGALLLRVCRPVGSSASMGVAGAWVQSASLRVWGACWYCSAPTDISGA